jgi:hypothetical protein
MAASRKDYEALAAGLARTRPEFDGRFKWYEQALTQWQHDRDAVAAALHETSGLTRNGNRSFDIDRFREACEA